MVDLEDINKLTVAVLQKEIEERGVPYNGKKKELVLHLMSFLAADDNLRQQKNIYI